MNYCKIRLHAPEQALRDTLIAMLGNAGFDAFEETEEALFAFAPEGAVDEALLLDTATHFKTEFTKEIIPQQNWNAAWEAGYEPVVIDDFCVVRAAFHPPVTGVQHEIVITPKMSFGTGHHATTKSMIGMMRTMSFTGKDVLDFGTGTGILAILSKQLGARSVLAIDHEEWAADNAAENAALNNTTDIIIRQGSWEWAAGHAFDIILANINRHILLEYMQEMSAALKPGGRLLLSGILIEDEEVITEAAAKVSLKMQAKVNSGSWLALLF